VCEEDNRDRARALVRLFADSAVVFGHVLLPPSLSARWLPSIDHSWRGFAFVDPHHTTSRVRSRSHAASDDAGALHVTSDRRTLHALHFMLPHVPWRFLPSGHQYLGAQDIPGLGASERWNSDQTAVDQAYQRHLLQVGYVDRLLGDLVEKMKANGTYDESLFIVVADHGCSFHAGNTRRGLTAGTWSDILRVPLLVKTPHQAEGVIDDGPVQSIDILPTIADVLGVTLPFHVDGTSLLRNRQDRQRERVAVDGAFKRFTPTNDFAALRETVTRKCGLFGSGPDVRRLFGRGRFWELVGQRVDDLPVTQSDRVIATLGTPQQFGSVEPSHEYLPALVAGKLSGAPVATPGAAAAIAINGVIRAVSPLVASGQSAAFKAPVPEQSFRRGRNDVAILMVDTDESGAMRITDPRTTPAEYSVRLTGVTERVESLSGQSAVVVPGEVSGRVDGVSQSKAAEQLSITGWVADTTGATVPKVLIFADGRYLASASPTTPRPDVAARVKAPLRSGFVARVSLKDLSGARTLRFFGMNGSRASELDYSESYPYSTSMAYRIVSTGAAEHIEGPEGHPIPLKPDRIRGFIDAWSPRGAADWVQISGWAADSAHGGTVAVVAFADNYAVATTRATEPRPDVAAFFKDREALRSGYNLRVRRADLGHARRIRLFGISPQGTASELAYPVDFLQQFE
jgi:hypothetical protein